MARTVLLRACAPGVFSSDGRAFLRAGMTAQALRAAMAAWQPRVSYAPSTVTLPIGWSAGIWFSSLGNIPRRFARTGGAYRLDIADPAGGHFDRPDLQRGRLRCPDGPSAIAVAWKARVSRAKLLTIALDLPVLSIRRCKAPVLWRKEMATFRPLGRRDKVLKFGTDQSSPARSIRLATSPVACRKGSPNSAFSVRHA